MPIESPRPDDAPAIAHLSVGAGVFNSEEVRIVGEMLDGYFHPDARDDHTFVIYRDGSPNSISGFACYGPTPLAERVWDLYWICVDRAEQRRGIGKELLKRVEQNVRACNGRAIYLETSDSEAYAPARAFYQRNDYEVIAHLKDFYAEGEGKVIYRKRLAP
ncbi:MAG: GNAT family N-acetyltransferase [Chloroflexi bacterium]|nr:GNAT family N-acetyltransferase [Chloroflexota bacterium]